MPRVLAAVNYSAILPHRVDAMLATQAAANGAKLVDVYAAGVGHDACALPGVRRVELVIAKVRS